MSSKDSDVKELRERSSDVESDRQATSSTSSDMPDVRTHTGRRHQYKILRIKGNIMNCGTLDISSQVVQLLFIKLSVFCVYPPPSPVHVGVPQGCVLGPL